MTVFAPRYGRANVLRWLLWQSDPMPTPTHSSADRDRINNGKNGVLALHYAAARGCLDCVQLLMESSVEYR